MWLIRPALADDYPAFTALFPELQVDDPVPSREVWESAMVPGTWVAVMGTDVVAYCFHQLYEDTGYVRSVVVAPRARRLGIGRALLQTIAGNLRRQGKTSWRLNVRPNNHAALALYKSLGFAALYSSTVLRLPWAAIDTLPTGVAVVRDLAPGRDRRLEDLFQLPHGQLASARSLGRVPLEAVSGTDAQPVGLAVFNPQQRSAFPFRVLEPDVMARLLTAIRAQAPTDQEITVVVESDPRLVTVLTAAGAAVRDQITHLTGAIAQ